MIIIVTKHTLECTKLHCNKKNLESMLPNPSSDIPHRGVFQHLLFSKIILPIFENGFRSLMYICFKANKVYYYYGLASPPPLAIPGHAPVIQLLCIEHYSMFIT